MRVHSIMPLVALGLVATGWPQDKTAPNQLDLAIVNARIEIGNGKVIEKGTVIIRGGKIVSVGPDSPGDLTTIDASGKVLYPGFIDGWVTRGVKVAPAPSEDGKPNATVTAPPTMWVGNRKGISSEWRAADNLDFERDESTYQAGFTTAIIGPGRGCLRGIAAAVDLVPSTVNGRVLVADAGQGMSFRNGAGQGYPSNILGVIALLRQTLADGQSYAAGAELYPSGPKPKWMASIEALQPLLSRKSPALFEANLQREIERAIRIADEFSFDLRVVGGRDAFRIATLLAERKIPVILNPDLGTEPSLKPPADTPASDATPLEILKERNDRWQEQAKGAAILQQSGVPIAFSSEGNLVSEFLANVRQVIKRGLPREAALKALTIGAAEIFGLASQTGSIEVGKRANLVLMDGDFASEKATVQRLWIDGRPMFEKKEVAK